MTTESAVLTAVLKYLGNRSDVKIWRHNTGRIADRNGRVVSFGLVGSADVIGMRVVKFRGLPLTTGSCIVDEMRPGSDLPLRSGQFLAVECKSATGRQSEAQRNFQKMVEAMGGLYLLVRDVADLYPWFPKET